MKPTLLTLLLAIVLSACGSLPILDKKETNVSHLGSIGKDHSTTFRKDFQQIGETKISTPIALTLGITTFTKSTFKKYASLQDQKNKQSAITFTDSLAIKPKYFTLDIANHVSLKEQLNNFKNEGVREYLGSNRDHAIISKISFVAPSRIAAQLESSKYFFLTQVDYKTVIQAQGGEGSFSIDIKSLEIFDFESSGFCWDTNTRGKKEIACIAIKKNKCPKGTDNDPLALDNDQTYLKF